MTKAIKILLAVVFSFGFLFTSIGYAQFTDTLVVHGDAEAQMPEAIIITDVVTPAGNSVSLAEYRYTVLTSQINMGNSGSSTLKFQVTVYNNTANVYGYNATIYAPDTPAYTNSNIVNSTNMARKSEDWKLEPHSSLTFELTFSYKNGRVPSDKTLYSVLEFEFLPFDQIPDDEAQTTVAGAMGRFKEILNDAGEGGDYEELKEAMENTGGWFSRDDSFISNVPGANNNDKNAINGLFAGNQHVNINGTDTEVNIFIKREELTAYHNSGNNASEEMVIYMTTNELNRAGSEAVVYVCVFLYDSTLSKPEWVQYGEMFEGKADVTNYSWGTYGTGSFNTDTWRSSYAYYDDRIAPAGATLTQVLSAIPQT